jgi:hypothetical protein
MALFCKGVGSALGLPSFDRASTREARVWRSRNVALVRDAASVEYALVKCDGVRRRLALRRLGRIVSLMEMRIVQMADGVKGGVIVRSESLVVCARRVAVQVERRGRGEGLSGVGTAPSGGRELREAANWSRRL